MEEKKVKERYIGKGDIKQLNEEKLGAFLEMDYNELIDYLLLMSMTTNIPIDKVKFKVLPNKRNDGYTVKISITKKDHGE
jgi:hypothetical protein